MDPRHLELLRELDERGSLTAVAEATHRTPSAVSQQLRAAQRAFGVPLVEAHGRGLRLTAAGRVLADAGREVASGIARAEARWQEFRGGVRGTVTVAALPSAAAFLLPGVLAALPDGIEVVIDDVDRAEREYAALTRDHDLVVGHSLAALPEGGAAGLVVQHLAHEPLDVAMAPEHDLAARERLTPEDVASLPWVGVPLGFPFDTVRRAVEQATGQVVQVRQRVRDNRLVEALVAGDPARELVGILPRFTTVEGAIRLRPLDGVAARRSILALARPDRAERLVVRRVLDALVTVAGEVEQRHQA
ncbi:DNA-binding transcriptional LysR family regulator [Nocardioides massiliensis]|uniref:DNA-binding transcriptional LysR family regulator n=2 Tax=Nocardioides massiliensis TaxID=1325935 RepID=A0ABT9NK71_9ACTN|nr:LysR family transcriptional regulator [Nocardioides massiliensis]MDP9820250.1 DNA-binding transcriptional LysR family regulator [Nocardioides massiliensis]